MPSDLVPMAQRPTDEAEPMMLWGDEQTAETPETWFF